MCGIAGIINRRQRVTRLEIDGVNRMLGNIVHRGPDARGTFSDQRVALGHQRLSIIDLSVAGNQPMANEDSTVWTVFNGEIYNHPALRKELLLAGHLFQSDSDTEVLLHGYEQWGMDGLLFRLAGMFAFALYDNRRPDDPSFYLVRDRLGIKPLYYSASDERVIFASEVRALAGSGLIGTECDRGALVGFLAQGSVPSPSTWLKNARCLQPGHYLAIGNGRDRLVRYWDIADSHRNGTGDAQLLSNAVNSHMLSDVPVGIFLSGGLDSASVVALVARSRASQISTLTIAFDESAFNEGDVARRLAHQFGTRHQEIRITDETFIEHLPRFLRCVDQPTADGVNTYFVSLAARQAGLKVVLSGLGGDEVFLGYEHYRFMTLRAAWIRRFEELSPAIRNGFASLAGVYGHLRGQERWERVGYWKSYPPAMALYLTVRGFYPEQTVADLVGIDVKSVRDTFMAASEYGDEPAPGKLAPADLFNRIEIGRYLHDQLLRDSDVFSMAHSIELRVPLLDHRLLESIVALPARTRVRESANKPLLVDAVNDDTVRSIAGMPKRGFTFPLADWIRTHADRLEELSLTGKHADPDAVRKLWSKFRKGRLHWSRVWALVVVEGTDWSSGTL